MTKILVPAIQMNDSSSALFELTVSKRTDERTKKAKLLLKDSAFSAYTDVIKSKFSELSHNINFSNVSEESELVFDTFTEQTFSARLGIYVSLEQSIFNRKFKENWDAVIISGNLNLENLNLREIDRINEKYSALIDFANQNGGKYLFVYVSDDEIELEKNPKIVIKRFSSMETLNELNSFLFTVDIKYFKDYVDKWGLYEGIHELTIDEIKHKQSHYTFYREDNLLTKVVKENSEGIPNGKIVEFVYDAHGCLLKRIIKNRSSDEICTDEFKKNYSRINFYSKSEDASVLSKTDPLEELVEDFKNPVRPNIKSMSLERDENGFITREIYHRYHNDKAPYKMDDSYGHFYRRDKYGRTIYQTELDINGEINKNETIIEIKYDENDDEIERKHIMNSFSFIEILKSDYDIYGNCVSMTCLDENNQVQNSHNCLYSSRFFAYDNAGNLIKEFFKDKDNNLVNCEFSYAQKVFSYRSEGSERIIEISFFDKNNEPAKDNANVAKYRLLLNEFGKVIEEAYFDKKGAPTKNSSGSYITKISYEGNVITLSFCDENGELIKNKFGYAKKIHFFDENGYLICESFFNEDGFPCINQDGYACYMYERNENGNFTKIIAKNEQYQDEYSIITEYDEFERITRRSWYDKYGKLAINSSNYAIVEYFYDDDGDLVRIHYLDAKDNFINTIDGYAIALAKEDGDFVFFDSQGKQIIISDECYDKFISEISSLFH